MGVEGVRALVSGLPAVVDDPTGLPGSEETLYGAYLSAVAFASAGLMLWMREKEGGR